MQRTGWMRLGLLLLMIPSASCETVNSNQPPIVIAPPVVAYSQEFQDKAAAELEAVSNFPVCPRDVLVPDCLAWPRLVLDFGTMREQARAATGKGQ